MKFESAMRKARALAKKFDITVEYERAIDVWWVYGPDYIYIHNGHSKFPVDSRDDPLRGNHNCMDAWEVLYAVRAYIWDIACHHAGISESDAIEAWNLTAMDSRWDRGIDPDVLTKIALRSDPVEIAQTIDMAKDRDPRIVRSVAE